MYLEGDGSPGASRLRLRERLQRPAVAAGHGLKERIRAHTPRFISRAWRREKWIAPNARLR